MSGEMQEITKQQTRLLRNLETYTKYTISVYAENKIGKKGASAVTETTTKGGGISTYRICLAASSVLYDWWLVVFELNLLS